MAAALLKYRPPRIAMALILGAAVMHLLTPVVSLHIFSSAFASVAFALSGFSTMMWAWWQFQQRKVAICPTEATAHLITDGIYRVTRNPMYLGIVMMLTGIAMYFGTLPFYFAVIVYILIIDRAFCHYEEQKLLDTFGSEYAEYRSRVRRWL